MLVLTWGLRHFWKRGNIRNGCVQIEHWGTSACFVWRFQENSMQSLSAFELFFDYKRNCKSFIFVHSLIIGFLWFVYGSNLRKRYTLGLLQRVTWGAPSSWLGVNSPQPFDTLFDSVRWAPFSLALQLCSRQFITKWCKIYTKLTPDLKNHEELG